VRELLAAGGLALAMFSATATAQAGTDHAAIAKAALEQYIRPGYAALADSAGALKQSVDTLCHDPSEEGLKLTRDAFAVTVAAWGKVEPIRFGPVAHEHRYERIFFWPDPKGIGARQVREALAKLDQSVTKEEQLAAKSVALQGLPPLQYLLYGDGADTLATASGHAPFHCQFAASVAGSLAQLTREIADDWQDGGAAAKSYLAPGPTNQTYHTPKEVTLDLFKTFTGGIEAVRDQKLAKMLGASAEQARPRLAPFYESGLTVADVVGNLEGVRDLFTKSGLAQVVHEESPGVEDSILFDLNHAIEVFNAIDAPVDEVVHDEDLRAKLEALRVSLKSAVTTAGDMIARGAGLAFGFNAMDGD
jgi:predicted lipoprotein